MGLDSIGSSPEGSSYLELSSSSLFFVLELRRLLVSTSMLQSVLSSRSELLSCLRPKLSCGLCSALDLLRVTTLDVAAAACREGSILQGSYEPKPAETAEAAGWTARACQESL